MSEKNINELALNEATFAKSMAYLRQTWSYIQIRVEHEAFVFQETANVIQPDTLVEDHAQHEFVYPIFDYGDRLLCAKDMSSGACMIKMHYTIEKMIHILYERYLAAGGGGEIDEFEIFLDGELLAMRKAFEVIINLPDNWVVMNFEPGEWGSNYLNTLQKLYDKGFDYPNPAPRDFYRHTIKSTLSQKSGKKK